jgi:hypothetical protein
VNADEPDSLADVVEGRVYRLRVARRLLCLHEDTLVSHGIVLLPQQHPNSPRRVLGAEILRLAGTLEITRSARTPQAGESERERQARADAARERVRRLGAGGHARGKAKAK